MTVKSLRCTTYQCSKMSMMMSPHGLCLDCYRDYKQKLRDGEELIE